MMNAFAKITYTPDPELGALSERAKDLMQSAVVERAEALETCVKSILRQVLKREPVLEDAKRLTLATHPIDFKHPLIRSVYFDDVYLGVIVEELNEITFKPVLGDKYKNEIDELFVDASEVSDVLNEKIEQLRLK